jgi:multisubunit Na+/H+ antiporter MnhC subunit
MNVLTTTQGTVEIRRSRLIALVAGVAVLAAAVTWVLSTHAVGTAGKAPASGAGLAVRPTAPARPLVTSGDRQALIMSITPAALAAGALGGYALPSAQSGPTTAQILASMSPATRKWTTMVLSRTFGQLKGGAAGWP